MGPHPPGTASSRRRATAEERHAAAEARRARRAEVTDVSVVIETAAAYLAVRPRSVDETRRRLRHLGYQLDLVEQAVARLVELGYLDDAAYARAWVESRDRSRPRGEVALRRELRARGIGAEAIEVAIAARAGASDGAGDDADPDKARLNGDEQAALRLVERRRASLEREPDPRRRRQKAYAMLARNGFDPDLCQRVATTFVTERIAV